VSELVDWGLAERVARAIAGEGPEAAIKAKELKKAAKPAIKLILDYTGLDPNGPQPEPELVDRDEWITVNLRSLQEVSAAVEAQLSDSVQLQGAFGSAARSLAAAATGVEVGLLTGYLSQRVAGQYDVALLPAAEAKDDRAPRLLFVGPNLVELQRRLSCDRDLLLRWIALHECTHVVQFAAVPWLRNHLGGMIAELLDSSEVKIDGQAVMRFLRGLDPRRVIEEVRRGDLVRLLVPGDRRNLLDRLQATMSVIEGYSEHVMDAVGDQLDPRYAELRERLERRRASRGGLEALVLRVLGLEMKMRQYRQGKAFCDAVVERAGIEALNTVWSEPAALPTLEEIEAPERWLERTAALV
jgi:coenzyme F420 biosynthesis associated uncharacterized protein